MHWRKIATAAEAADAEGAGEHFERSEGNPASRGTAAAVGSTTQNGCTALSQNKLPREAPRRKAAWQPAQREVAVGTVGAEDPVDYGGRCSHRVLHYVE